MIMLYRLFGVMVLMTLSLQAVADGLAIDRVYEPTVTALERELEVRTRLPAGSVDTLTLGYGQTIAERVAVEGYVTLFNDTEQHAHVQSYEAEVRWQLTETGEYALDWGLMLESEYEPRERIWEKAVTVIASHQAPRWTGTVNLALVHESGSTIRNEFETEMRGQWRYRWHPQMEPGVEIHLGEMTRAIGPVLSGRVKLPGNRGLAWEVAALVGFSPDTPDATLRTLLEWEF